MRNQNRLRPLHMRVGRDDHLAVAISEIQKRPLHLGQQMIEGIDRVSRPKLQIGDDLVVAAAARVQFATQITQPGDQFAFYVSVDVLEGGPKRNPVVFKFDADLIQGDDDFSGFLGGQQTDFGQHLSVRLTRQNVVRKQTGVHADGLGELFNQFVGGCGKSTAPCLLTHCTTGEKKIRPGHWKRLGWLGPQGFHSMSGGENVPVIKDAVWGFAATGRIRRETGGHPRPRVWAKRTKHDDLAPRRTDQRTQDFSEIFEETLYSVMFAAGITDESGMFG